AAAASAPIKPQSALASASARSNASIAATCRASLSSASISSSPQRADSNVVMSSLVSRKRECLCALACHPSLAIVLLATPTQPPLQKGEGCFGGSQTDQQTRSVPPPIRGRLGGGIESPKSQQIKNRKTPSPSPPGDGHPAHTSARPPLHA